MRLWLALALVLPGCLVDIGELRKTTDAPVLIGDSGLGVAPEGGAGMAPVEAGSGGGTGVEGGAGTGPMEAATEAATETGPLEAGLAYSAISGFALWDATSDVLIDSSFEDSEQITLPAQSCVAIEIIGNKYLADGFGSVKKVFDADDKGCTLAGITHENSPPFAWEKDTGNDHYECAPSLTVPGIHTLSITPFDGDDCSGTEGLTVTLTFSVIESGT